MIRTLIVLLCCCAYSLSHAQSVPPDNSFVVGGSLFFISQRNAPQRTFGSTATGIPLVFFSNSDFKINSFSARTYVGKRIVPKVLVGLSMAYEHSRQETSNNFTFPPVPTTITALNSQYSVGAFARYRFRPEEVFDFFVEPELSYNQINSEADQIIGTGFFLSEIRTAYLLANLRVGLLYQLSGRFRLILHSGGLTYANGRSEETSPGSKSTEFSSFQTNFNLSSLRLGGEFLF